MTHNHFYFKEIGKQELLREAENLLRSFSRWLYVFSPDDETLHLGMQYREDWMLDIKDELESKLPDLSRSEIDSMFDAWFSSEQEEFLKHEKQKNMDRKNNEHPYSNWREAYNAEPELMVYLVKKYEGIVRYAFKHDFLGAYMMTTKVMDDIELTILTKSDDIRLARYHAIEIANRIVTEIISK